MKIFKKLILLSFIFGLMSCGTLKKGFSNQKKNTSDEFLVEKKSPLIMPPDYNELPKPQASSNQSESEDNSLKILVTSEKTSTNNSKGDSDGNNGLEKSLLEKINNN
tara:strand:+ start:113 stop:433 length:321 start_codon:yes stop_codon:yes gene_type:complete